MLKLFVLGSTHSELILFMAIFAKNGYISDQSACNPHWMDTWLR